MRTNSKQLGELASISTILTFRDKNPEFNEAGNAYAISIKDLTSSWPKPISWLQRIEVSSDQLNSAIEDGDILMPARGTFYPARYVQLGDEKAFPIGQIYVIKATEHVYSRYLAWYLNRTAVQSKLAQQISGTTVMSLKKSSLSSIEIALPLASVQRKIGAIHELNDELHHTRIKLDAIRSVECDTACELLLEAGL